MTHYVFPLKTTIGGSVVEFISLALSTTQSVAPYAGVQSHLPPRLRDVTNAPADVASGKRDGSMWSHNQNTRLITSSTPERNDAATPSTSACSLVSEHNTTTPSNASSCKQQGLERARQKKKSGQRKTCRYQTSTTRNCFLFPSHHFKTNTIQAASNARTPIYL